MYFYPVNLENAHVADLPNLARVKQLHLACALIEIVSQCDAVLPFLDFTALRPQLDVHGVARLEHLAKGTNVNALCHSLTGMRGQTLR